MSLDETDIWLLKSVRGKRKVLDTGRSPVMAIMRAFELERQKYITFGNDMTVYLTQKGIDAIEAAEKPQE